MKMRGFLFTVVTALSASALAPQAEAFPVYTQVYFEPGVATIAVTNPYAYPIACAGTIQAQRSDGFVLYQSFELPYVPYGATQTAFVYTYAPFYFMNVYGWADCGYLW